MEQYSHLISTIALTMGVGWASGINLYAAVVTLGLLGATGNIVLPQDLQILTDPVVIFAAGTMYVIEFITDKIPGIDSSWDALHTFIRIPAGAILAASAVGDVSAPVAIAAGLLGAGLATGSHAAKAGTRVMINTSPEPFTNWFASIGEDVAVIAGIWTALHHPVIFLVLLACFLLALAWLLPRLWTGIKRVFHFLERLFSKRGTTRQE